MATRGLALACALAVAAGAVEAQELTLDRSEARVLAAQLAVAGDPALAAQLARGLIEADPGDRAAWAAMAGALIRLGEPEAARRAAAEAHRLSGTPVQRYEAARLAALAAADEGRFQLAGLWLRRALTVAPDAAAEAQTRRDSARVRSRSLWRVEAELSFAPSSNVNGGSETPYNVVDGLPVVGIISVDGRALSGWAGTLDVAATRRLSESPRQRTQLTFRAYGRGVLLSDEAQALIEAETDEDDPAITGADFSSTVLEVGVGQDRAWGRAVVGGDATLGATWFGGDLAYHGLRLSGDGRLPLGEGREASGALSVEQRFAGDWGAGDVKVAAEAGWAARVAGRDRLSLEASAGTTLSDNGNAAGTWWGVEASYALGRAVGPARLRASLGATWSDFPGYAVLFAVPGGRQDEKAYASVEATLTGWDYAGFAPVVSLEASRTGSNVSRFEGDSVGIGFGLRSTF